MPTIEVIMEKLNSMEQRTTLQFETLDEKIDRNRSDLLVLRSDFIQRHDDHEDRLRGLEKLGYALHSMWAIIVGGLTFWISSKKE